jgi:predicted dehydrogenase
MNSSKKIGVAVIGLGVGEQHARTYLATPGCELRWLYDLDQDKARALRKSLGVGGIASSYAELLQDRKVDLVSIASFDDAHYQQVLEALRAGKHVFVEKPLCRSMEELRRIKRAWDEQLGKLKLYSNLVLRAAPVYRYLKEQLDSGELGKIYAFDGEYLYGRLDKITQGWRKDEENYSVMLGGGVHLVDLMLTLTGERPDAVWAQGNNICTAGSAFRYHDFVAATMHFPSGLIGRITANFGCVHRHQHVVRIFGTKGTFLYDDQGPRIHRSRDPEIPALPVKLGTLPASKGDLIPGFVRSILNNTDTRIQTEHEFAIITICAAADEALASGNRIEVEYV